MKNLISKLTNTNIVISLISGIITIVINCGFKIDDTKILVIANTICGLGVLLGIMTKGGQETPKWNK